jgi:hypothetical protein
MTILVILFIFTRFLITLKINFMNLLFKSHFLPPIILLGHLFNLFNYFLN